MTEHETPLDLQESENLQINQQILGYLLSSAKWGTFLAITGFVVTGLIVILALFLIFAGSNTAFPGIGTGLIGIVYLILAALYFVPSLLTLQFSQQCKRALKSASEATLTDSFSKLRALFKYFGILTIVTIALYLLGVVGFVMVDLMG